MGKPTRAICPKCNETLDEPLDMQDVDYTEEVIITHSYSHCQKCHTDYKWQTVFLRAFVQNLEVDN